MNRFPFLLARWESRSAFRRVGIYALSISLGVAALVAVRAFRADVSRSVEREAQVLMGADVRLSAQKPFPDSVVRVVDSLVAAGHPSSTVVTAASMILAPANGNVRLFQVRAVDGDWPFYGEIRTVPAGLWDGWGDGEVIVDPAVLTQLGVVPGDTLRVGEQEFTVAGTVENAPTELGFQTAIGPRVYLRPEQLQATEIMGFGSLARYETFLLVPEPTDRQLIETRYLDTFREGQVRFETAEESADDITDAVGFLGRYLGLVGLGALLLGGIGVASAIHVFVKERLSEVAVLRCIGARQVGVFSAYLLQAGALGLAGAVVGAAAGAMLQQLLPIALAGLLPVPVETEFAWRAILGGIGIGVWVALAFALLPLLSIRNAPPLRALRHDLEVSPSRFDPLRIAAAGAIAGTVVALAVLEAPSVMEGLAFSGALATAVGVLWFVAFLLARLAERAFPRRAAYVLRQGVSNLFRPGNQTVSVTLALGFGTFVVATVLMVQANLAREIRLEDLEGQPNLLLFDIQSDQRDGVVGLIPPAARSRAEVASLVPSRIRAINGMNRIALQGLPFEQQPAAWAMRRDYRNTFRWELTESEELIEGAWWDDAPVVDEGVARISMEVGVARDLKVGIGDRISWEISGVTVESEITSLRSVDWGRFQTNFFVVFEPGGLDAVPATYIVLARMEGEEGRAAFQRSLIDAYPNVSVLDLSRMQAAIDGILSKVGQAIAFLAAFAALAGILVLAGALASSRHQRLVEGALLRTLGARRHQVWAVLLVEYLALATLAALTGLGLALTASGILVSRGFEVAFEVDYGTLALVWGTVSTLTILTGILGSRELLSRPPLPTLRGE